MYHNNIEITLDHKQMEHFDIKAGSVVFVADKGIQVPIRGPKLFIYLVPPLIFVAFQVLHSPMYSFICAHVLGDHRYLKQS